MSREIDWDDSAENSYVLCVYGTDGDEPGDCYTRVGVDDAGQWWVDDGDDDVRDEHGPYATRAAAEAVSARLAAEQDQAEDGEDADGMRARLLTEAAGEPDPEGEWCVYWETVGDDAHVVERYATRAEATARATQLDDRLHATHPGGGLLCGHSVRALQGSEWIELDDLWRGVAS